MDEEKSRKKSENFLSRINKRLLQSDENVNFYNTDAELPCFHSFRMYLPVIGKTQGEARISFSDKYFICDKYYPVSRFLKILCILFSIPIPYVYRLISLTRRTIIPFEQIESISISRKPVAGIILLWLILLWLWYNPIWTNLDILRNEMMIFSEKQYNKNKSSATDKYNQIVSEEASKRNRIVNNAEAKIDSLNQPVYEKQKQIAAIENYIKQELFVNEKFRKKIEKRIENLTEFYNKKLQKLDTNSPKYTERLERIREEYASKKDELIAKLKQSEIDKKKEEIKKINEEIEQIRTKIEPEVSKWQNEINKANMEYQNKVSAERKLLDIKIESYKSARDLIILAAKTGNIIMKIFFFILFNTLILLLIIQRKTMQLVIRYSVWRTEKIPVSLKNWDEMKILNDVAFEIKRRLNIQ